MGNPNLPAALLETAHYDTAAKAAVVAIQHGADPVETLAAAVVVLADWKREWSPEAMRAMMQRPPAPIHLCCAGKHGEALGSAAAPVVASEAREPLTREEAIKPCARAGYLDQPGADEAWEHRAWWTRAAFCEAADRVLRGRKRLPRIKGLLVDRFRAAVLAEARRLVASGECPALANEPALRGGA